MKKYALETTVGMFVLIGLVCVAYLTIKLGKLEIVGGDTNAIKARFKDVTGLKNGAYVEMAGVRIGRVSGINLDPKSNMPIVSLDIQNGIMLTDDAMASIKTSV
jgi:phospholipid/cholesterol/gamma-HCH transport system substrate-binding protein